MIILKTSHRRGSSCQGSDAKSSLLQSHPGWPCHSSKPIARGAWSDPKLAKILAKPIQSLRVPSPGKRPTPCKKPWAQKIRLQGLKQEAEKKQDPQVSPCLCRMRYGEMTLALKADNCEARRSLISEEVVRPEQRVPPEPSEPAEHPSVQRPGDQQC